MENIPRIHDVGLPRRDSKIDEKVYSVNLSIHVNDIVWGENGNIENVFRILLKFRNMLACFFAVVGHSWDLDQRRNGARTVLMNQTEI